jgi:hypothetical protein
MMNSAAPDVEHILQNTASPKRERLYDIQKRYRQLVDRGIIHEEGPKTAFYIGEYDSYENTHIEEWRYEDTLDHPFP